ncbi:MAG TPA: amidohydrolase family protein, partial [Candidatus Dormibacteraeota bacterium]|nr:amidohydrolase family protein [Candidatus Dormibacteraeota bacterium]
MQRATLVIVNGRLWGAGPGNTAVAVAGDRIVAAGADSDIRELAAPSAQVIDAAGATIMPAFNDAHVHFLSASCSLGELDLHGASTQGEVERRIEDYARRHAGPWLVGRGWFYSAFPGGMPAVELLDRLVPDRPAYIESFDAHTGWANSQALRIAGAPPGEVLKESSMLLVTSRMPSPSRDEELEALRAGMRLATSRGIGSVQEAGGGLRQLPLWESMLERGEMIFRVRLAFDMKPGLSMSDWG